jgi:hypothetical protein
MKPNIALLKANGMVMMSIMPDESAGTGVVVGRTHMRYDCSR